MTRAMPSLRLGLIAALTVAFAGCGGGSDSSSTTASAVSADAVKACLSAAGLDVTSEAPTDPEMEAVLYVNVDQIDQVYLAFMETPEAASRIADGLGPLAEQAGGNAGAEVAAERVVLARAHDTTGKDVRRVKACLTG